MDGRCSAPEQSLLEAHRELLRDPNHRPHKPPVVAFLHLELLDEPLLLGLPESNPQRGGQGVEGCGKRRTGLELKRSHQQRPEDLRRARDHLALRRAMRRRCGQQPCQSHNDPVQRQPTRQRALRNQNLRLLLQLQQLWCRIPLARLRVCPKKNVPNEPHHRADRPLVDCLVLLCKPGQRLDSRIKGLRKPLRSADHKQRQVPVPQGLGKHLIGRVVDWRRHHGGTRPSSPREVARNRRDEEASQVHEDGVELIAAGGGEETNDGADEAHVEGLRMLLATPRHQLHHGHKDWRGRRVVACEAQDVAEGEADLLHELLVLGVVDADPLDRREVLLHDCQHGMVIGPVELIGVRRHVVHAGHRGNVQLELQRGFAVVRRLHRARARGLHGEPAEYGRQRLLHTRDKDVQHLLQLAPIVEDGEDLADAEDQLRAAVHVEPRVRDEGDHRRDHFPPEGAPVGGHDALPRGRHDHFHGVACDGLAVLLRVGIRHLRQHRYRRQVLHGQEAQDLLAGLRVQREVP
mmetsp:Transcript_103923/g.289557  ORF Transcript_103923/g.289557 Transcript_103923/m.289557 type:complete len:519 (+) Transcript_103923:116-1672(+)